MLLSPKGPQYLVFFGLTFAAMAFTSILYFTGSPGFQRYFGGLEPLLAVFIVILNGFATISVLLNRGWFIIYQKEKFLRGLPITVALASAMGLVIILVDLAGGFPAEINVRFPESLLFYPVMGFVVEAIFHLMPLTLLLLLLTSLSERLTFEKIIWPCILLISVAEPIFQAVLADPNASLLWVNQYVAFHIFLINLFQLWLFKRYDFVSMYAFRLMYYLIWHIGWGWLRLEILF